MTEMKCARGFVCLLLIINTLFIIRLLLKTWGTVTPKDIDEVNRREVDECDG